MKTKPPFSAPKIAKDGTPVFDDRQSVPVTEEGGLTNVPAPEDRFPKKGWEPL